MAQNTSGLRALLSMPAIYSLTQNMLGANKSRSILCREYLKAGDRDVVVDVGCGPAEILEYLPKGVDYHGFDLSAAYIDAARDRHGQRGTFHCRDVTLVEESEIPPFDLAFSIGVLHHLDDDGAIHLLTQLKKRLASGGRLVTVDPAYYPQQSPLARVVISRDRGQNVRTGEGYRKLASQVFPQVQLTRRDDLLNIPYTHAILECTA